MFSSICAWEWICDSHSKYRMEGKPKNIISTDNKIKQIYLRIFLCRWGVYIYIYININFPYVYKVDSVIHSIYCINKLSKNPMFIFDGKKAYDVIQKPSKLKCLTVKNRGGISPKDIYKSPSASIMLNCKRLNSFPGKLGIRQGCLLSPFCLTNTQSSSYIK